MYLGSEYCICGWRVELSAISFASSDNVSCQHAGFHVFVKDRRIIVTEKLIRRLLCEWQSCALVPKPICCLSGAISFCLVSERFFFVSDPERLFIPSLRIRDSAFAPSSPDMENSLISSKNWGENRETFDNIV